MNVWLLVVVILALACTLTHLLLRWREMEKADHAKCTAHIASVTSSKFVGLALMELAERYDSMDGSAELRRIRNTATESQLENNSIPALWMREKAKSLWGQP